MSVKTRVAPSPTGEFHIGGVRTFLYNYAFAKQSNGKFVLRIEDTDRERLVEGALERLLEVIKDYGLSWDEGPEVGGPQEPYVQSKRLEIYRKYAEELVDKGAAYRCFCSKERLDELRKEQQAAGAPITKYDKRCLLFSKEEVEKKLSESESYVIRLDVSENEEITFEDMTLGTVTINTKDIDDQVLLKSDGFPTYHLAVVVDDHLMGITHVMRGVEWLPSTPKHIILYREFGWDLPTYVHLPLLKEKGSSKKLSKRTGDVDAREFLKDGYLPEAVLNFLMFLGWNPGTEREIYSVDEFIEEFSVERIHKTDLVVFDRDKLLWFNGQYIRALSPKALFERVLDWSEKYDVEIPPITEEIVGLIQERLRRFDEISDMTRYFFEGPTPEAEHILEYVSDIKRAKQIVADFKEVYEGVSSWDANELDTISHGLIEEKGYKPKEAFMTVRLAVSGSRMTPPLFDILQVIGKDGVISRLEKTLVQL